MAPSYGRAPSPQTYIQAPSQAYQIPTSQIYHKFPEPQLPQTYNNNPFGTFTVFPPSQNTIVSVPLPPRAATPKKSIDPNTNIYQGVNQKA